MPNRTWRQSTSLGRTGLLKIGEAAITTGDLGFAVNSYTKLGTDKLEVVGNFSGSSFGWMKGDLNVSGQLWPKDGRTQWAPMPILIQIHLI
ncbi:hypothetical protein [Flavobacterium sp. MMS24-S5]|uniref:hypothetical protein n=1 Tax=Flavobacterium sp. MMS24-S5 TaxID=3416605 RepID=UPI003CFC364D